MRYAAALTPPGTPRPRSRGLRKLVLAIVFAVIAAWALYGYAQEAYLGHRLSQQVADLKNQNSLIAAQNDGYRRDIQAISNGAADEEEARMNGYSKANERVFLVTAPPTPSPAATPAQSPTP
jgi:cell division protein FtsB